MLVAGVDVGNSTTELAVARLTPGAAPDFLGVWRVATTGAKGSTACAAAVSELVARAERRLGEPLHRLLLAELNPVDTGHFDVHQRQVETSGGHLRQRFLRAVGHADFVTFLAKPFVERVPNDQLVVNYQQF